MLKGKRALVTGSSGFIGSVLVGELTRQGATVVGLDKTLGHDICDSINLRIMMRGADYVFHLAVLPFNPCAKDIRTCVQTNIIGTLKVAEAATDTKVEKLIYSSASAVYGNIDDVQAVNEHHPRNPNTIYGVSKLMGELIIKNSGVPYIILRYMNVYGDGQKSGLVPALLKCIRDNVPPTIDGDGSQAFDFVHVSDIAKANILAAISDAYDETFNIGGENEITVLEVAKTVLDTADSDLKPVGRPGNSTVRRVGSSDKAGKLLGYRPSVDFKTEIRRMVHECENEHTNH